MTSLVVSTQVPPTATWTPQTLTSASDRIFVLCLAFTTAYVPCARTRPRLFRRNGRDREAPA
jgi:hypothetical protein